jgi:hypothetical protein
VGNSQGGRGVEAAGKEDDSRFHLTTHCPNDRAGNDPAPDHEKR